MMIKRSIIIQRQTDKIKAKNAELEHLRYIDQHDPRKAAYRNFGQFDKAQIKPLIEDEE